jgi:RNA polymerase sigma-70 factor (sigma-E family)
VKFEEEFVAFAEASAPRLRRTAYLLCGDWHTAEDLVQSALARVFVAWRRIRQQDSAHAYATRTLMNCYLADRRRKRPIEILTDHLPDFGKEVPEPETRLLVLKALAGLPPKSRAVVVLRYWADLSIEDTAAVLGCSPGNVRSQSVRALAKLRTVLDDALSDSGSPRWPDGRPEKKGTRNG